MWLDVGDMHVSPIKTYGSYMCQSLVFQDKNRLHIFKDLWLSDK